MIKREEFEQRKEAADQARQARLNKKPKKLASQGKQVEEFPLLQVGPITQMHRNAQVQSGLGAHECEHRCM